MKKPTSILLGLVLLVGALLLAPCASAEEADLASEDDKILYAVGLALAQQIVQLGFDENELAIVQRGIADAALDREPKVDIQTYGPKLQGFAEARLAVGREAEKARSAAFLEQEAAKAGAMRTESGIVISEITAGTGPSPSATDQVRVHYHGTLSDGTVFDSSVDRGEPVDFGLDQVVPCWTQGLQTMKVGGKSRLVCPSDLAYGDQGRPPTIPGGAALVFEVELLEVLAAPEAPEGS